MHITLVLQNVVETAMQKIRQYLLLIAIGFALIIITVATFYVNNAKTSNITIVHAVELACDINVNEDNKISIYKLTVAGRLRTGDTYADEVPPMVFRSFDLITDGSIDSIKNIVLSVCINEDMETIKYDLTYAVLEDVDIGGTRGGGFPLYLNN